MLHNSAHLSLPMKQTIYVFLLLILLTACGGDKENEGFTLTVELDVPDQTYLYFWQEEHKKGITVDSVLTEKGRAVYKGVCGELSRIEICTEAGQRVLSLYVKNGDKIKLKGSVETPYEITFSGPIEQEQIGKFRNDNHTLLQRLTDSDRDFYSHIGDTSYQQSLTETRCTHKSSTLLWLIPHLTHQRFLSTITCSRPKQ